MFFDFFQKSIGKLFYIFVLCSIAFVHMIGIDIPDLISKVYAATREEVPVESYTIPLKASYTDVVDDLHEKGFIKSKSSFKRALKRSSFKHVEPGAYMISKSMSTKEIAKVLKDDPYMVWVVIPEGIRKEQVAERLKDALDWTDEETTTWLTMYDNSSEYREGVYFPDTYLIGKDETPEKVMNRFITNFNRRFAPYFAEFQKQNIKWTTGITIASLIERETAGAHDMRLISGIIWNRLNSGMKLDIDATLQYIKGYQDGKWWNTVKSEDKKFDSPYNTYMYKGVPPGPIANPGIAAIEAVLYPEETKCFYYLHDTKGKIHCAPTYEEHKENIERYLR